MAMFTVVTGSHLQWEHFWFQPAALSCLLGIMSTELNSSETFHFYIPKLFCFIPHQKCEDTTFVVVTIDVAGMSEQEVGLNHLLQLH